jgi:hypothetical protein
MTEKNNLKKAAVLLLEEARFYKIKDGLCMINFSGICNCVVLQFQVVSQTVIATSRMKLDP